jgi:hypothetical protein
MLGSGKIKPYDIRSWTSVAASRLSGSSGPLIVVNQEFQGAGKLLISAGSKAYWYRGFGTSVGLPSGAAKIVIVVC